MSIVLADILAAHWQNYAHANREHLSAAHYRAVRRVLTCRTAALGGRLYRCEECAKPHFAYHSCNHRSCPQCGSLEQQLWTAKQEAKLLPVPYFMVTFTVVSNSSRCNCGLRLFSQVRGNISQIAWRVTDGRTRRKPHDGMDRKAPVE